MNERFRNARRRLLGAAAIAMLPAVPLTALAQESWPSRPITVVVPYPAGGVVDIVARAVTDKLSQNVGQPVIVQNKPGASANIGAEFVARAPADGYTLLMGSPFLATNPLLAPNTRWKPEEFVGIANVGAPPNVFVVSPDFPAKTMREFVEHVKARPGKINAANPGIGSSNHLGQELFFSLTGLDMVNVMYKGQPAIIPDLASGQVSFALMTTALATPHVKDGKLRALAVSSPRRLADLPQVPTIAEAGYPQAMFLPWYGFVAPAGTPPRVVQRLSDEFMKALSDPQVIARLEAIGTVLTPAPAKEFDALIRSEVERWSKLIRERNIPVAQ